MLMLIAFVVALLSVAPALGAPQVPADDDTVLERLPGGLPGAEERDLKAARAELAGNPGDPALAAEVARRLFRRALATGDPRYVGYAAGALARWRTDDAPAEVLYARGLVKQYTHDFAGALRDLSEALKRDPGLEEARAWRAAILMVRAEYDAADLECRALPPHTLLSAGCKAYVEATTGRAAAGYARLSAALAAAPQTDDGERLWVLTRLAEMAWRMEDAGLAEKHFRDALSLGVEDDFLLAAYADFLLEKRRPQEVLVLLRDRTRSDTLLLRLALAGKALRRPEAEAHARALGERFAAAALRGGERLHLAEESRYLLELKGDAKAALAAALENWKHQREPRDALAVLEAAVAAGDREAAEPVLRWLAESRFESARLAKLAASLK